MQPQQQFGQTKVGMGLNSFTENLSGAESLVFIVQNQCCPRLQNNDSMVGK